MIIENRKAKFDYNIHETYEAGIILTGGEIKSVRRGKMQLKGSHVAIKNNEVFLVGCHITPYIDRYNSETDPIRDKKLLLHKSEIVKLKAKITEQGYTIIATKGFFVRGKLKIEIAVAKGKKNYDKRQVIKEKDMKRMMQRTFKSL